MTRFACDTTPLTREEESRVLRRAKRGCVASRNLLVERNLGLLYKLAVKWRSKFSVLDVEEYVSVGAIAVMRCVDKFDASTGNRFTTYAGIAAGRAMLRAGQEANDVVRRPHYARGYDLTVSLDRERDDADDGETHADLVPARPDYSDHSVVERRRDVMRILIPRLSTDQRRTVARLRMRGMTQPEIGRAIGGVTKSRVQQVEKALVVEAREMLTVIGYEEPCA